MIAPRVGLTLAAAALLIGATPVSTLSIDVSGLRSAKGSLRICLTADPANFPSCVDDAQAVKRSIPATQRDLAIPDLAQGDYAVAVIHDENNNKKLDTLMGIPREGFGFSRNPPIGFGAPRFSAARFTLSSDAEKQQIAMRYLL